MKNKATKIKLVDIQNDSDWDTLVTTLIEAMPSALNPETVVFVRTSNRYKQYEVIMSKYTSFKIKVKIKDIPSQ